LWYEAASPYCVRQEQLVQIMGGAPNNSFKPTPLRGAA